MFLCSLRVTDLKRMLSLAPIDKYVKKRERGRSCGKRHRLDVTLHETHIYRWAFTAIFNSLGCTKSCCRLARMRVIRTLERDY